MASRYDNKNPSLNNLDQYREVFDDRGVKFIRQYGTVELSHPNRKQIAGLEQTIHVWKRGDRFYKLASQYYGGPQLWWIIAWYNKKPTESHLVTGQVLNIPSPLSRVLSILRVK